ncbi:MAG: imidazole glycerol phosphate synthase subunit HisH [Candidatus Dormibacteria bacterium]|jgi:glutamine amidotransferase
MPRIAIVDYGVGNLRSVERALARAGAEAVITPDPRVVAGSDAVVLPGVGAFAPAAALLFGSGLGDAVREAAGRGRPVLGVCLGFQLLFDSSEEGEGGTGLGLLSGRVRHIVAAPPLKVPHMGWNSLRLRRPAVLTQGVEDGTRCYFVHSYAADADPAAVVATVDYGGDIVAICERGVVTGTQFHPEKSGPAGLRIYANLVAAALGERLPAEPSLP